MAAQRPYSNRPGSFGLFARMLVLDDAMYELMQVVPAWLARWSLTQGWIGQAREELSLHPWLNFYVQEAMPMWQNLEETWNRWMSLPRLSR